MWVRSFPRHDYADTGLFMIGIVLNGNMSTPKNGGLRTESPAEG